MIMRLIGIVALVVIVGGVVFLSTWDMPPPAGVIEKPVPAERLVK